MMSVINSIKNVTKIKPYKSLLKYVDGPVWLLARAEFPQFASLSRIDSLVKLAFIFSHFWVQKYNMFLTLQPFFVSFFFFFWFSRQSMSSMNFFHTSCHLLLCLSILPLTMAWPWRIQSFHTFFPCVGRDRSLFYHLAELDLKFAFSEHYGSFMFPIEFSGSFVFVVP